MMVKSGCNETPSRVVVTSVGNHLASFTIEMAFVTASVQENREKRPELSGEGDGECVRHEGRGDSAG